LRHQLIALTSQIKKLSAFFTIEEMQNLQRLPIAVGAVCLVHLWQMKVFFLKRVSLINQTALVFGTGRLNKGVQQ
jgi:hypothetical protein